MRYVIITGANRGLGYALVDVFKDDHVITVTRSTPENSNINDSYTVDFKNEEELEEVMDTLFKQLSLSESDEVVLINNAAVLRPVKRVEDVTGEGLVYNYKVNLLAPALIMKSMIHHLKDVPCQKKLINVTSGAAINPVSGWSAYCSAKAGLSMFSEVVNLEQKDVVNGVKTVTFRPGVIDTDMQEEIRNSNPTHFKDVERFKDLKKNNELLTKDQVAKAMRKLIESDTFGESNHYSVQDFL